MTRRKNKHHFFEKITVTDAGAKGKSIAKTSEGAVIFIENAVPGDVVDIQTFKKKKLFTRVKLFIFIIIQKKGQLPNVCILAFAADVNGKTWHTNTNCFTSKKK